MHNVHAGNAVLHGVQAHHRTSWPPLTLHRSEANINSLNPKVATAPSSNLARSRYPLARALYMSQCVSQLDPAPSNWLQYRSLNSSLAPMPDLAFHAALWADRLNLGTPDAVKGRRLWRRQGWSRGTGQHWAGQHSAGSAGHAGHLLRLRLALVAQDPENEPRQLPIK